MKVKKWRLRSRPHGSGDGAGRAQDSLCSFMPRCTPSDDPDADFSLQGGADQAAHL